MKNSTLYRILGQVVCIISTGLFMFPLILMLVQSFAVSGFRNYLKVFEVVDLFPNFLTSIIVVFGTLLVVSIVTSMAAFAFSKLQFKGKSVIYYILLTGMMIPTAALIFPLFRIVKGIGINNTPYALILPYASMNSIFNLMVLKNYIDAFPNELMEAAYIDGASNARIYLNIVLPITIPGLAFILIQTFLSAWNELQMAMIFINNPAVQPISVVPLRFVQTAGVVGFPIEVMYASLVICLCPIAIFYILTQRFFVQGLVQGAVKG